MIDYPKNDQVHSELVPLRTFGQRLPLFCMGDFRLPAEGMHADQPIYHLHLINLEAARTLTVEQLAEECLQQIFTVQRRGPYRLAGYSFGGLVVHEMATLLLDRGEEVGLLALFDTAQPQFLRDLPSTELRQFRRNHFFDRVRKYANNLRHIKVSNIRADASRFANKAMWKVARKICRVLGLPLPSRMRSESRMLLEMWHAYTPKVFNGRLVLFVPEDRGRAFYGDPRGWEKYARMGIDVNFVPGSHATMMRMPNILTAAIRLSSYL